MLMPSIFGENLFDDFFTLERPQKQYEKEASCDLMKTDIREYEGGFELDINLPGCKKEDIQAAAVVGGGDVAIEDAIFLARICEKVYLIHRRNELRGAKSLQKKLMEMENVEILWDTVADSINGENKVESLSLTNKKTGEKRELPVDGVFIAVGISPNTEGLEDLVAMDGGHYILAGEDGKTSRPGIFAAGDVRTKNLRQIVTAVADGANCVTSAERYLNGQQ